MYARIQLIARLSDIVKETEEGFVTNQDLYYRNGTIPSHPYVERGMIIDTEEFNDLIKAYKEKRLYFKIP